MIHCVERAPPAGPGQSSPAAAGSASAPTANNANPDESVRENRNRNRVRNQMERHVQQFVQSLALLGDQADQTAAGNEATHIATESDMESFARQLSGMADALEQLPSHIRPRSTMQAQWIGCMRKCVRGPNTIEFLIINFFKFGNF